MKKWEKFPGVMIFWGVLMMTGISGGGERIILPSPGLRGEVSVEEAILKRRSVRSFLDDALSLGELFSKFCFLPGITRKKSGFFFTQRGALSLLVIYAVVGKVEELTPGVYRATTSGTRHRESAGRGIEEGSFTVLLFLRGLSGELQYLLVFAAIYERTTVKTQQEIYRSLSYHSHKIKDLLAQNVYLQTEALQELGTVAIRCFL